MEETEQKGLFTHVLILGGLSKSTIRDAAKNNCLHVIENDVKFAIVDLVFC